MKSIAQHLGVDEKLVVDVASGEVTDWEAFHEYTGYGEFYIDPKLFDAVKKEYYRRHANSWTRDKEQDFKDQFNLNEHKIDEIVTSIHQKINFNEAPLYLPEIIAAYPDLKMKPFDASEEETHNAAVKVRKEDSNRTLIEYPVDIKMRPYIRYRIAKAVSQYFFEQSNLELSEDLGEHGQHIIDIQSNLFAAKLLTPAALIRSELGNVNVAKDIVSQLSEIFWVSKTFMNGRLKEILQKTPRV